MVCWALQCKNHGQQHQLLSPHSVLCKRDGGTNQSALWKHACSARKMGIKLTQMHWERSVHYWHYFKYTDRLSLPKGLHVSTGMARLQWRLFTSTTCCGQRLHWQQASVVQLDRILHRLMQSWPVFDDLGEIAQLPLIDSVCYILVELNVCGHACEGGMLLNGHQWRTWGVALWFVVGSILSQQGLAGIVERVTQGIVQQNSRGIKEYA